MHFASKAFQTFLGINIVALSVAFAGASAAADLPAGASESYGSAQFIAADPAKPWQGIHFGILGSYSKLNTDVSVYAPQPIDPRMTGFFGGVLAGADIQLGNIVLGAEADTSFGKAFGENPNVAVTLSQFSTFRGRAGYAMGNVLLYGTAGLALADLKVSSPRWGDGNGLASGWTYGGGVETKLTENISLRGEYLYTKLDSRHMDLAVSPAWAKTDTRDFHTFRAAVTYNLPVF